MTESTRLWALGKILGVFILFSIIMSCRSNKTTFQQVVPRTAAEVLDSLSSKNRSYDFFYGKAKMKFNGTESRIGGRMTVMMIPDSVIWMNFKKISIEGARTLIRPDSMWILYRFDDLYEADLTQEYLDFYKVDIGFSELQDLMIGNYTLPNPEEILVYQEREEYLLEFDNSQGYHRYKVALGICAQDLEEVSRPHRQPRRTVVLDTAKQIVTQPTVTTAPIITSNNKPQETRDPDTYRKEAYIHSMLRHTYYHKITTSPWSRYLKPKGWTRNVQKWRYWAQLNSPL